MLLVVGLLAGCTRGASDVAAPQSTPTRTDRSAPDEDGSTGGGSQEQLEPGTTAIFRGGPATGPWQQIGSVAEITHPRAAPTARRAYDRYWAAYGLSSELWDELAARVNLKLVKLGRPANRPTFDGAPGSEPFNAGAGLDMANRETGGLGNLVSFMGTYHKDKNTAARAHFAFLVAPQRSVVFETAPIIRVSEQEANTLSTATSTYYQRIRHWVTSNPRDGRRS